ncbi:cytochrome P450 [Inquilinus limosus]|uniref:Cytochrome P450 n=1 Tax=Inquilinus limosus MP06 TaxID=1398085 RepID=A0A0A0DBG0_9PROT|nr:cytochrome P450 [Inquilinus limosus]KGM36051.1 hypothetical protein P409_00820 [Inquilinus limosus MP06]
MASTVRKGLFASLAHAVAARRNGLCGIPDEAYAAAWTEQAVLGWRFLLANDPEAIRAILTADEEATGKARWVQRTIGPALGDGLLSTEGEDWRRSRVVVQPMFHPTRITARHGVIVQAAEDLGAHWRAAVAGGVRDVTPDLSRATREILLGLFFDPDFSGILARLGDLIPILQETAGRARFKTLLGLPRWWPDRLGPEFRRARLALQAALDEALACRRADPVQHDDLPGRLLAAGLDDARIRAEITTLFFAGYETTANGMAWAVWELAHHPDLADAIRDELLAVTGGALPIPDQLSALDLTNRMIHEVLRLYPPGWIVGRRARRPLEVPGSDGRRRIRRGTTINIAAWVTHRSPRHWPDPERFDPERFLEATAAQRPRGVYLPFGHGPRACPGRGLALAEMSVLVALIARDFRIEPAGLPPKPLGRVTLRPGGPVTIRITPRS